MANQFLQYPLIVTKTANGYEVSPSLSQGLAGDSFKYVFQNMADLTYWLGLNEQAPAPPAP